MRLTLIRLVLLLPLAAVLTAAEPLLTVNHAGKSFTYTAGEFAAMPHRELTVPDPHNQPERRFTGVAVSELLARLGLPQGQDFRGPALAMAVVFRAKDGYAVTFALAEFEPAYAPRTIILADREAGLPLPAKAAPLQVIAPGDKMGGRWARMVTSMEVVSLAGK